MYQKVLLMLYKLKMFAKNLVQAIAKSNVCTKLKIGKK